MTYDNDHAVMHAHNNAAITSLNTYPYAYK